MNLQNLILAAAFVSALISTTTTALASKFEITVTGDQFPTIVGKADVPDGTRLFINIKKPWLPDAKERLARGLPACEDNCIGATDDRGVVGITTEVRNGKFSAGPFSFNRRPMPPMRYPIEISIVPNYNTASAEVINAGPRLVYQGEIPVAAKPPQAPDTDRSAFFESRYLLSGFLLRASRVCSDQFEKFVNASVKLISGEEFKSISGAFPTMTGEWMERGALNFNTGVLKTGPRSACDYAKTVLEKVDQIP